MKGSSRLMIVAALWLAATPVRADTAAISRENFLALSTGRAPFRPLYDEAIRNIIDGAPGFLREIAAFEDGTSTREWTALYRVASEMGASAGPPLLEAIEAAENDTARWALVVAFGATRDSTHAWRIAPLTRSMDRRIRAAAALALGEVGSVNARPALIAAFGDSEAAVRRVAVDALGRIAPSCAEVEDLAAIRDALERAESDPDPWVRRNARRALENFRAAP